MIASLIAFARICLCALPAWAVLRRSWKRPSLREAAMLIFLTYMTALLVLALDGTWQTPAAMVSHALERIQTGERIQLLPLTTIIRQIQKLPTSTEQQLTQLLGNTLLFIPWGLALPMFWPRFRSTGRMILMCLLLTCTIEFMQLFIGREVDIDDVLLNFLGGMLGVFLWQLGHRLLSHIQPKRS